MAWVSCRHPYNGHKGGAYFAGFLLDLMGPSMESARQVPALGGLMTGCSSSMEPDKG